MKSYIIRIELEESDPLIWRKVIMPAGDIYNRLHDVIQNVKNFKSGYPHTAIHLFEFDLVKENRIVTNDEEAFLAHQFYKQNKKMFEEKLRTMEPELQKFEEPYQERLKREVRKPTGLKIDDYLEKYKEIRYNYDFGDDWWFTIKLEEIAYDYYFGYPTLLDGAETAPPEDVGGMCGFYEFMEVYRDEKHPEHDEMKAWAEAQHYREYDPIRLNEWIKCLNYKKTEWDKITLCVKVVVSRPKKIYIS
jgi:hypothetical protein